MSPAPQRPGGQSRQPPGTKSQLGPLSNDAKAAAKAAGCTLTSPPTRAVRTSWPPRRSATRSKPPTSGNHDPTPQADGAYLTTPDPRHFVHTLEHGRIEIQYQSSVSKVDQLQLKGVFDEDFHDMLLFPNNNMPFEVAATSWDQPARLQDLQQQGPRRNSGLPQHLSRQRPEPASTQPG